MDGDFDRQAELRDLGMNLYTRKGEKQRWFAIATRHTRLDQIFDGTDWSRGGWAEAPPHAPDSCRPGAATAFVSTPSDVWRPLPPPPISRTPLPQGDHRAHHQRDAPGGARATTTSTHGGNTGRTN